MNEPTQNREDWNDVELLILAAGSYVRPSEELRHRVLDAARVELGERNANRRIWRLAIATGLLGAMLAVAGTRTSASPSFSPGMLRVNEVGPDDGRSAGWNMVDAFTDLRRRQAALLSLNRPSP